MTRKLKALGLALVAMLTVSAMAASAQAEETPHFTTFNTATGKHESAIIKGNGIGSQIAKATASAELAVECTESSGEGTTATGTETTATIQNVIASGDAPEGTCTTKPFSLPVHTRQNGCDSLFHITGPVKVEGEEGDWYEGTADIKCPEGKVVETEVTKSGGGTKCTATIPPQNGIGPITLHNRTDLTPTGVEAISNIENIDSTTAGGLLNCGVANGTHASGVGEGAALITAQNTNGEPIDLTVMEQDTP